MKKWMIAVWIGSLVSLVSLISLLLMSGMVEAAMPGMYQLRHALDPIVVVIQAACYPVGMILMFWGILKWALDDPNGMKLLRKGVILIIAAYWIPWMADLASQIGEQAAPYHLQQPAVQQYPAENRPNTYRQP